MLSSIDFAISCESIGDKESIYLLHERISWEVRSTVLLTDDLTG